MRVGVTLWSAIGAVVLSAGACTSEGGNANGPGAPGLMNAGTAAPAPAATAGTPAMVPTDPAQPGTNMNPTVPPAGTAGSGAVPPPVAQAGAAAPGGAAGADAPPVMGPKVVPSARNGCPDLHTDFVGDDACLAPPDPAKGFQIHIGPSSYTDPAEIDKFIMEPGQESSECYMKKLPIDKNVLYMVYELSGRPGTHHIINTLFNDSFNEGWGICGSFLPGSGNAGSIGGASKPHMPPIPIAPENENLGIPLTAHQQVQHDMHYFNFTQEPILREFWMNVYYIEETPETIRPMRIGGMGGFGFAIAPGTHQTYKYECPINGDGRIIQLLGHTHAHGIRETAHIRRKSGERMKVFEQYDYLEPQIFMYDSLTQNPPFSDSAPGAHTGMLPISMGDVLEWECEVNNTSDSTLYYTNEVKTGEMCNIWGMTVGPAIQCQLR